MELIRGLSNLRERHHGSVVSIGNFDGFHRGHQALVARLREHARRMGLPTIVLTFEPTPREYFSRGDAPGRVATFRDKLAQLEAAGVDRVLCVRFGRSLAAMTAEQFVEDVLVGKLGAKAVLVGDDFRFGANRAGDLALLQRLGARHGFVAEALGTVEVAGGRASSSAVRAALAEPDLSRVAQLLGRPYRLGGRVRRGLQLGRKLGMPTLNVVMRRRPALRFGVYAVRVRSGERIWDGVASIGVRPTLMKSNCLLEAHLFGMSEQLYGALVEVEFVKFLRPEQRFEDLDALAVQMQKDGDQAQAWLKGA
ncbi:MAG TPA: bifunctional riboflavin kinase/FAD synthetase [Verrucomicrobiae bacterium]|nr:bifunctional riboflavin kinase/FAD synthetase [Verrucomicrobiae bacterium]